jgi:DNA-binding NarL/FixJ family response regulator
MAARTQPHIVIMDISMPGMNGVECTRALRNICPDARVIVYTMHADQRFLLELFQAGIAGHVLKEDAPSVLLTAISEVYEGKNFFSHSDACAPMLALLEQRPSGAQEEGVSKLSRREKEIFIMLADGQGLRTIAEKLHISLKTVEAHKYNICNKLQTSSLSELTKMALRSGLISI